MASSSEEHRLGAQDRLHLHLENKGGHEKRTGSSRLPRLAGGVEAEAGLTGYGVDVVRIVHDAK